MVRRGRKSLKVKVLEVATGKTHSFNSSGEMFKELMPYSPSGQRYKDFVSGEKEFKGYKMIIEEEEEEQVIETKEPLRLTTEEMYLDLGLSCKKFCEKYGCTELEFYKLHYYGMKGLTTLEGFYESMLGKQVDLHSRQSVYDKEVSKEYHTMEFNPAETDSVMITRYKKLESILNKRRALKDAINFKEFMNYNKGRRFRLYVKKVKEVTNNEDR